jgi:hypothetical protein
VGGDPGRNWQVSLAIAAAAFLGGAAFILAAAAIHDRWRGGAETEGWREIAWPFPRDAWPPGRAFRCIAAACGEGAELYVRPKIGFCNCTVGVADDNEVDRVTDLDLISERFVPLAAGEPIRFADMSGRARAYSLQLPDGRARPAVGLAVARGCDVVVAVIRGKAVAAHDMQHSAIEMLSSDAMTRWINSALEGG